MLEYLEIFTYSRFFARLPKKNSKLFFSFVLIYKRRALGFVSVVLGTGICNTIWVMPLLKVEFQDPFSCPFSSFFSSLVLFKWALQVLL